MPISSLKFIIDVGVGKKVEDFLYKSGYDVNGMKLKIKEIAV